MVLQLPSKGGLYIVDVQLPYKDGSKFHETQLVLDTGAVMTIIDTDIIHYMGYSARTDGIRRSALDGAGGRSEGFLIQISQFRCMGVELSDFQIACHDLDTKLGVAGLLGMNFLQHFHMDIDFRTGAVKLL